MPDRQKNWLKDEVEKADGSKDYVILENPAARKQLDDLIVMDYTAYEAYGGNSLWQQHAVLSAE